MLGGRAAHPPPAPRCVPHFLACVRPVGRPSWGPEPPSPGLQHQQSHTRAPLYSQCHTAVPVAGQPWLSLGDPPGPLKGWSRAPLGAMSCPGSPDDPAGNPHTHGHRHPQPTPGAPSAAEQNQDTWEESWWLKVLVGQQHAGSGVGELGTGLCSTEPKTARSGQVGGSPVSTKPRVGRDTC